MELMAAALKSDTVEIREELFAEHCRKILRMPLAGNAIAFGKDGIIQFCSAGASMLTGYGEQEVVGRYTPTLFHDPQEMESRGAELSRLFARPVTGFRVLVEMVDAEGQEMRTRTVVRKDFSTIRVQEWVEKLPDSHGESIGYIMLLQPEPEIAVKTNGQAVKTNSKLHLLGNLAHAIRTPMNAVLGFATLLRESTTDQAQRLGLEKILENGKALLQHVDDTIDWAELEETDLPAQPSPLELDQLAEDLRMTFLTELKRKSINLSWDIRPIHPREFHTDVRRFRKVLERLIRMALDRTPRGWIHLQFLQEEEDAGTLSIQLSVPALPFRFNGNGAATRPEQTLLNDSSNLLRALGGTLQTGPPSGGHQPFFARLQIRGLYAEGFAGNYVLPSKTILPSGLSILHVDPNPVNRDLLRFCLKSLGLEVTSAADESQILSWVAGLSESVAQIRCREPDLILVSIDVLNGIEPPAVWVDRKPEKQKRPVVLGCIKPGQSGNCQQTKLDGLLVMPFHPAAVGRMFLQLMKPV